jgi:aminoglycoside phosphotransferase (APT) family kinase protein
MRQVLDRSLAVCRSGNATVLRCRITPLRYRPGKRCTLRIEVWLRDRRTGKVSAQQVFGKLYHTAAKATAAYRAMQMLADAPQLCASRVVLAQPAAFIPELRMVVQKPVEGVPLDLLLGCRDGANTTGALRGWDGVVLAASALAALHTAGLSAERERSISAELARFRQRAAQVSTVDAALGARMDELAAALPGWLPRLSDWGAETSPVHGDCKPSQFLIGPAHVALLDWDHCGLADPASDVGTFLASLRQIGVRQMLKASSDPRRSAAASARMRWLQALEQRFLDEYSAMIARGPGVRHRAAWYQAVALLRKALRAFARSPRSPLPDALVAEAWHCLRALPPVQIAA